MQTSSPLNLLGKVINCEIVQTCAISVSIRVKKRGHMRPDLEFWT